MKKMVIALEDKELYIGNGREIKNLYKNLEKHFVAFSIFEDEPDLRIFRNYGLMISHDEQVGGYPTITIINSSDIVEMLLDDMLYLFEKEW